MDKTVRQQYHAAMARIEQALSLAPISLSALAPPLPERAPAATPLSTAEWERLNACGLCALPNGRLQARSEAERNRLHARAGR